MRHKSGCWNYSSCACAHHKTDTKRFCRFKRLQVSIHGCSAARSNLMRATEQSRSLMTRLCVKDGSGAVRSAGIDTDACHQHSCAQTDCKEE
eukprot:198349-Amphidinium_carterae.1